MSTRRRQSASASTPRSARDTPAHKTRPSSSFGSATPRPDDDEEGAPRRATRHRNPLPPTSGPLFPPLPPKQTKHATKEGSSSRSPATWGAKEIMEGDEDAESDVARPGKPSGGLDAPAELNESAVVLDEDEDDKDGRGPHSGSNTSLTPPPPTSDNEEMDLDIGLEAEEEKGVEAGSASGKDGDRPEGDDDQGSPQHQAAERGPGDDEVKSEPEEENPLPSAPIHANGDDKVDDAKVEEDEDNEPPARTRNGKPSRLSHIPTPYDTPASSATPDTAMARSGSRQGRKRRGEEQLLLDDHLLPAEIRRTTVKKKEDDEEEDEEDDDEEEGDGEEEQDEEGDDEEGKDITRCVCKREDIDVMMIQCDQCNVWQHGECMGIWGDDEAPDEYFCEECKPERHQALKKWLRSRGRNTAPFIPPSPEKLEQLHSNRDPFPPSQSKRWSEPPVIEAPPPPPISKSARSHHKKDKEPLPSPVETADSRRTRGRQSTVREKPPSTSYKKEGRRSRKSLGAEESDDDDSSPQPSNSGAPAKKRSTMNSRDAAYEEAVKAALEASKREMEGQEGDEDIEVVEEKRPEEKKEDKEKGRGGKRRRNEDEEEEKEEEQEKPKKGKRRKEEEPEVEFGAPASQSNKPKHPNQYTYRPKPPSSAAPAASPSRRMGTTPVPSSSAAPLHHEHGTRRAGALASAPVVFQPLSVESANHLNWNLPDHLIPFAEALPSDHPEALEVPAPRVMAYLPRNHFHNQQYGPFTEDRDEQGRLRLPTEQQTRETVGHQTTQLEPPARIKFPPKRVTSVDIKRRIRTMLEFVGKHQVDESNRVKRAKLIGIKTTSTGVIKRREERREHAEEKERRADKERERLGRAQEDGEGDTSMEEAEVLPELGRTPSPPPISAEAPQRKSVQLMTELTERLIAFQEAFSSNDFTALENGYAASAPVSPRLPEDSVTGNLSAPKEGKSNQISEPHLVPRIQKDPTPMSNGAPIQETTSDIGGASEGVEVYRAGLVNKVMPMDETEREVARKVEEIIQG
ncbi:hypothetical protein I350_02264 [Cryptococcus amylolentus CBS 6273]|uniref:Zinc finger PHD-type domain-containing protein n=1 Tax=Cryptococcus amylolentus CBS 6273 TaxID=1296118 RepID=A0A1E3KA97_9TREE|nr:hypothetical protein I350_02264 [Cryptococcus amylolentus CBS 6273]